jgi:hypothetical protein
MPSFTVGPYEARSNDYFGTRIEMPHDVWKFQDDYAPEMDDLRLLAGSWEMYAALQAIAPLRENGLLEELWSVCRRSGQHDLAERITAWSNQTRAVLAKIGTGPA